MDTGLTEERSDRREQDKGKERQIIIISMRERNETQSEILLSIRALPNHSCRSESLSSEVNVQAWGWSMGFEMFRVRWEWSDVFRNGVHHFRNAY